MSSNVLGLVATFIVVTWLTWLIVLVNSKHMVRAVILLALAAFSWQFYRTAEELIGYPGKGGIPDDVAFYDYVIDENVAIYLWTHDNDPKKPPRALAYPYSVALHKALDKARETDPEYQVGHGWAHLKHFKHPEDKTHTDLTSDPNDGSCCWVIIYPEVEGIPKKEE